MIDRNNKYDLVVIGGGQSAKAILMAVARAKALSHIDEFSLCIYEESARYGCGFPWDPDKNHASHLSSLAEPCVRVEYGKLEHERFLKLVEFLREEGVKVEVVQDKVHCLNKIEERFITESQRGVRCYATNVVLATGYTPFDLQPNIEGELQSWPFDKLISGINDKIQNQDNSEVFSILVKGNYLSAVDTILGISESFGCFEYSDGQLVYQSRLAFPLRLTWSIKHNFIPKVWGKEPSAFKGKFLNWEVVESLISSLETKETISLNYIADLIMSEIENEFQQISVSAQSRIEQFKEYLIGLFRQPPEKGLKEDIECILGAPNIHGSYAAAKQVPYQNILFGILPMLSELSPYLSLEDKEYFNQNLKSLFYCASMPMALENACKLDCLINTGLLNISEREETLKKHFQGNYSAVVSASGFDMNLSNTNCKLTRQLLDDELILRKPVSTKDSAFNGIQVNPRNCLITNNLGSKNKLFAMGPLISGEFMDAQSIGHIQRDAQRIINEVCAGK